MVNQTLSSGFLRSSEKFANRNALEVSGEQWTYAALRDRSAALAATLLRFQPETSHPLTAVLAHRSITAFSGILGTLFRGHGYVPLNPQFPANRLATILERSLCESLVVGEEALGELDALLERSQRSLTIYLPDGDVDRDMATRHSRHRFVGAGEFAGAGDWQPEIPGMESTAYLLFTSGSTGIPKGVQVSHANIRHFIDVMVERYSVTEHDRFSQMFELVFDLSLFDMFVAWECGACLCCPTRGDAQLPARFINDAGITIWFSVPSLAVAMAGMRMLRPGIYPDLRLSLFCGEALRSDIAAQWASAAPNSVVENLYGPTEVTLACTLYRCPDEPDPHAENGLVPVGYPYPGMEAIIVDDEFRDVADGEDGELLMSGPQVAIGYWQDQEKTDAAFLVPPGRSRRYYRTGDLVRRSNPDAPIVYRGRIDHQVKIRGNRIELGEIEVALRAIDGVEEAVAVGWPRSAAGIDAITAFIQSATVTADAALEHAEEVLPAYMKPREVVVVDSMPLNQNGKIDRKALLNSLENG